MSSTDARLKPCDCCDGSGTMVLCNLEGAENRWFPAKIVPCTNRVLAVVMLGSVCTVTHVRTGLAISDAMPEKHWRSVLGFARVFYESLDNKQKRILRAASAHRLKKSLSCTDQVKRFKENIGSLLET